MENLSIEQGGGTKPMRKYGRRVKGREKEGRGEFGSEEWMRERA